MTQPIPAGMEILAVQAQRLGLHLTPTQLGQFAEYTRLLSEGNRRANLTAVTDADDVQVRHYLDSLTAVLALPQWPDGTRVVDIGAGAGFPGVPLKIAFPGLQVALAESVGKKARFMQELVEHLDLPDVEVLTVRGGRVGPHLWLPRRFRCGSGSGRGTYARADRVRAAAVQVGRPPAGVEG